MKSIVEENQQYHKVFIRGFIGGIGWALGVTLGFTILVVCLTFILKGLGGLPIVGEWFADLIEAILNSLNSRTFYQG